MLSEILLRLFAHHIRVVLAHVRSAHRQYHRTRTDIHCTRHDKHSWHREELHVHAIQTSSTGRGRHEKDVGELASRCELIEDGVVPVEPNSHTYLKKQQICQHQQQPAGVPTREEVGVHMAGIR